MQRSKVLSWTRAALAWCGVWALGVCLSGCPTNLDGGEDSKSGPDKTREGAVSVSLGAATIDNIDAEKGDKTDWKFFTVPSPGVITVEVSFDNRNANGEVLVVDPRGVIVSTYQDERRAVLDKMTFQADPGQYYIQIWANAESSDYTLRVSYNDL